MFKIFRIFIIIIFTLIKSSLAIAEGEKIKLFLVPMSGENVQLGELLIKSTKLALMILEKIK